MENFDKQSGLADGQGVCEAANVLSLKIGALETTALSWKSGQENSFSTLIPCQSFNHPQTRIDLDNDLLSPAPEKVGTEIRSDSIVRFADQPERRDLPPALPKTHRHPQAFEFTEKEVVNIYFSQSILITIL